MMKTHYSTKDFSTMTLGQILFAKGYCGTRGTATAGLAFTDNVHGTDCVKCIDKLTKNGKR